MSMLQQLNADLALYLGEEFRAVTITTTNGTELRFRIKFGDQECIRLGQEWNHLTWSNGAEGNTPGHGELPLTEIDSIEIWTGKDGNEQITWTRVGNTLARVPSSFPVS